MNWHLNIQESSLKKKRATSLFGQQANLDADAQATEERRAPKHVSKALARVEVEDLDEDLGTAVQTVDAPRTGGLPAQNDPDTAKSFGDHFCESAIPGGAKKPSNNKRHQPKEIVSAMVRLNSEGLNEPVDLANCKVLPELPGSAVHRKTNGTKQYFTGATVTEAEEFEYSSKMDSKISACRTVDPRAAEDATTVFDIVHRGRQVQQ